MVGGEAANGSGVSLTAEEQLEIVNSLTDGELDAYRKLHELYNSDSRFKAAIDDMKKTLTDGTTIDPEDARQRLLNAGISSDYLHQAGNLDNH